jgi:hypothetical protein
MLPRLSFSPKDLFDRARHFLVSEVSYLTATDADPHWDRLHAAIDLSDRNGDWTEVNMRAVYAHLPREPTEAAMPGRHHRHDFCRECAHHCHASSYGDGLTSDKPVAAVWSWPSMAACSLPILGAKTSGADEAPLECLQAIASASMLPA